MEALDLDVINAESLGEALCSADGSDYPTKPKIFQACNHCFLQLTIIILDTLAASMLVARPTLCTYSTFAKRAASTTPRQLGTFTSPFVFARRQRGKEAWISFRAHRSDGLSQSLKNYELYWWGRRRFSSSPVSMHGHLTPPKPGEE